jgi:TonB-linked SusC/RagA family outer membrane protein
MLQRIYILVFLLIPLFSFSQNATLSGSVFEESTKIPLIGATIVVQGTSNGTTSDFDGNFSLPNVKVGDVLEISYLGFLTQSTSVQNFNEIIIFMEEDAASLEQVLIIGYGAQKRKEITGAVAVIGKQTIEDLKPQRIEQAIQGQVAGVQITSNSGAPGSGLNINIRGISTNGDNRPLILLDGSRIEDLSVVNPADIESINILKDATAGIYGVQAANGVIIITSKKGKLGSGLKVDFSSYYGIQETTRQIPVLNATEYGLLINEARANGGQSPLFTDIGSLGQGTNWQDAVFEAAPVFNAAVTVGGGGQKSRYTFGASYLTQDGIVGGDKANFERITARAAYNVDIVKDLKFDASLLYTGTVRSGVLENTIGSVLYNALNNAPTFSIRDATGAFSLAEGLGNEVINPLAQLENTYNEGTVDRISGSFGVSYRFLENFKIETRFQANYADVDGFSFSPTAFYGSGKVFNIERNSVVESKSIFKDYIFDAFATYEKTFKEDHNVTLLLGNSISQTVGSFSGFTGFDIENNSVANASISQATDVVNNFPNGNASFDSRLLSYFTRLQYDYKGKYLFSGLARRDGSTKF